MILKIFEDVIAEIVLDDSDYAPNAMDIARELLARGVTAARIIRTPGSSGPGPKTLTD